MIFPRGKEDAGNNWIICEDQKNPIRISTDEISAHITDLNEKQWCIWGMAGMARAIGATLKGAQKLLGKKIMTKLWYCAWTRRSDIVTEQERTHAIQGRNEVKWQPGHETSLASPLSDQRSVRSKFTVLKNVHMTLLRLSGASRSHLAPPKWFGNRVTVPPDARKPRPSHATRKDRSVRTTALQARRY